ncbi:hypothetical protein F0562_033950 [Nyssa sinensis]|uniref:Reverse transcriptase domain-containing protein n=1 Tax=Nyssa sinensis TaxID=561372 RepID=A0A5J5AJB8_9ASTE|nr:hypothetical protein F0562_033950 [Nyssa sinensis]
MDSGSPSNSLEPSHVEKGPIEAIEIDGNSNSICSASHVLNLSPQRENIHDTDENLTDKKFTLKWTKLTIIMAYSTVLALLSTTFVKYGGKLLPEIFIQHPTSYAMSLILLMVVFFFAVNGVIFSEQSPPISRAWNLVALEHFQSLKTHRNFNIYHMALKLDMSKAYDHVEWSFLGAMMEKLGFAHQWINWIMACVSSVSYSGLLNGLWRAGSLWHYKRVVVILFNSYPVIL